MFVYIDLSSGDRIAKELFWIPSHDRRRQKQSTARPMAPERQKRWKLNSIERNRQMLRIVVSHLMSVGFEDDGSTADTQFK